MYRICICRYLRNITVTSLFEEMTAYFPYNRDILTGSPPVTSAILRQKRFVNVVSRFCNDLILFNIFTRYTLNNNSRFRLAMNYFNNVFLCITVVYTCLWFGFSKIHLIPLQAVAMLIIQHITDNLTIRIRRSVHCGKQISPRGSSLVDGCYPREISRTHG